MEQVLYFIKRLYKFAGNMLIVNIIGMVLISLLESTGILMLLPLISISGVAIITEGNAQISAALELLNKIPQTASLPIILTIYLALVVGQNLLQRSISIRDMSIQQKFLRQLRLETYGSVLQSNWQFFLNRRNSDLINALTTELTRVGAGTGLVLQLAASIIFTVIQIGIAFWLSIEMTAFVLTFGLLLAFLSRKYIKKSKALGARSSELSQNFLSGISEQINGIKDVKSNNLEKSRMDWFHSITQQLVGEQEAYMRVRTGSQLLYKISSAVLIVTFIYMSLTIFHTKVTQLLIIFVIFSRLWPRFTSIQSNMEYLASTIPAFQALIKLQQECLQSKELASFEEGDQDEKPLEVRNGIECRHVYFRYSANDSNWALNNVNLQIPAKRTTAIVGRSGAGKSTLIDIIMGLMQPESGQVWIDGEPLTGDQLTSYRQSISYVPQDPFLFHASIRENLLMIDPLASEAQLWEALHFSAAADFVMTLPHGLDTIIGDRGVRLSGGERQRLVLARAILRKPSILILDEATSALDSENETKIQGALDRLKGTMTIIVIAHRLSTIRNADQVMVLDQGSIIQKGEYNQLANDKGGLFSLLLGNQAPNAKVIRLI